MKKLILTSLCLLPAWLQADTADDYFHRGAQKYVFGKKHEAKAEIMTGLQKFPTDARLQQVLAWFREEDKKDSKEKNGDDQKKDDQQQNGQDQKEKDKSRKGSKEDQDTQEAKSGEKKEGEPKAGETGDAKQNGEPQRPDEGAGEGTGDRKLSGEMKTDGAPPVADAELLQANEEANAAAKNQMTEAQARVLLESMRGEEERVKLQERNERKRPAANLKDW